MNSSKTTLDPVCGMKVDPASPAATVEHAGRTYYFCSQHCATKFRAEPAKFIQPTKAEDHSCCHHGGEHHPEHTQSAAPAPPGARYTCPMHPEVIANKPGDCPQCGMALEPMEFTADMDESNPELASMTRRFWVCLALTLPVFVLEMTHHFGGRRLLGSLSTQSLN